MEQDSSQANEIVVWMVMTMMADGEIDSGERDLILKYASRNDISTTYIKNLSIAAREGSLAPPVPDSVEDAKIWMREMLSMAFADGEVTSLELAAVHSLAKSAGMSKEELKSHIESIRSSVSGEVSRRGDLGDLSEQVQSRRSRRRS